jgi:hypothetical protein
MQNHANRAPGVCVAQSLYLHAKRHALGIMLPMYLIDIHGLYALHYREGDMVTSIHYFCDVLTITDILTWAGPKARVGQDQCQSVSQYDVH